MTTTVGKKKPARARHDRWADWAVIGTLVVALLLGWVIMALADGGIDIGQELRRMRGVEIGSLRCINGGPAADGHIPVKGSVAGKLNRFSE